MTPLRVRNDNNINPTEETAESSRAQRSRHKLRPLRPLLDLMFVFNNNDVNSVKRASGSRVRERASRVRVQRHGGKQIRC